MPARSRIVVRCLLGLLVLGLAGLPGRAAAQATQKLFHIERNKNKNTVHYDARLGKDGQLDPKEPVVVYWLNPAGKRWTPTWFDRVNFYGFTVKRDKSGDFWVLRIHSAKDRPMKVYVRDGAVRAEGRINGRAAFLRQMYVSYKLDSVIPGVEYVDLIGVDAHTGAPLRERYKP